MKFDWIWVDVIIPTNMEYSKDNIRTTQGSWKTFVFWNCRPFSTLRCWEKKGGNVKTRKFFNYPDSFLYCLYSRNRFRSGFELCWFGISIHLLLLFFVSARKFFRLNFKKKPEMKFSLPFKKVAVFIHKFGKIYCKSYQ